MLFCSTFIKAEDSYPFSYHLSSKSPNIYIGNIGGNIYSITGAFGTNFDKLIIENDKKNKDEIKLPGSYIDVCIIKNNLFIFSKSQDTLYISATDNGGKIIKNNFIKLDEHLPLAFKIIDKNHKQILFEINRNLYKTDLRDFATNLIDCNVLTACPDNEDIYYIRDNPTGAVLYKYSDKKQQIYNTKLNILDNPNIFKHKNSIYIVSGIKNDNSSSIINLELSDGQIKNTWIEANINKIFFTENKTNIYYSVSSKNQNILKNFDIVKDKYIFDTKIPAIGELLYIKQFDDTVIAVIENYIISFNYGGRLLSTDNIHFDAEPIKINNIFQYNGQLILSNGNQTYILYRQKNKWWWVINIFEKFGKYIIPIILIMCLFIIFRIYRKNKKLLDLFIDESGGGATMILDKSGRISRMNAIALNLLDLKANYNKRKKYTYYLVDEFTKQLKSFIDKSYDLKESYSQKINFNEGNIAQEWLFSSIPLTKFTGNFDGLVIKGIDITEELEKNRLHNWSQLAHDMQTNLTTIRLNAEQIKTNDSQEKERAGKILNQVNILIQRVRDIVTVGRTNELNLEEYDSAEICREVMTEFDKTVFPDVIFNLETSSFKVKCDKPKIIRAIRNAMENGIKSMKNKTGTIILSNSLDSKYYYFKIKDSGVGMDSEVKKKMLTPYFTTGSKTGGFGIGTMIMQHVVELHGGELLIESEPNKGTEITFAIPNIFKPKKISKTIIRKKIT